MKDMYSCVTKHFENFKKNHLDKSAALIKNPEKRPEFIKNNETVNRPMRPTRQFMIEYDQDSEYLPKLPCFDEEEVGDFITEVPLAKKRPLSIPACRSIVKRGGKKIVPKKTVA